MAWNTGRLRRISVMQQGEVADKHQIRRSVSPGLSLRYFKSILIAAALQPLRVLWHLHLTMQVWSFAFQWCATARYYNSLVGTEAQD